MADSGDTGGDAQITFKVKSSNDKAHTVTMAESATVLDLKTKLAGSDFEDTPVERQRLIYSGRIMKDSDALSVYKIKHMNTIHMVKSARSNPPAAASSASSSTPTPAAIPQNMASGSAANDILAGLTGARYAGHLNLPSADAFGADGGVRFIPPRYSRSTHVANHGDLPRWARRRVTTRLPRCCQTRWSRRR
jgi:ubiquilin